MVTMPNDIPYFKSLSHLYPDRVDLRLVQKPAKVYNWYGIKQENKTKSKEGWERVLKVPSEQTRLYWFPFKSEVPEYALNKCYEKYLCFGYIIGENYNVPILVPLPPSVINSLKVYKIETGYDIWHPIHGAIFTLEKKRLTTPDYVCDWDASPAQAILNPNTFAPQISNVNVYAKSFECKISGWQKQTVDFPFEVINIYEKVFGQSMAYLNPLVPRVNSFVEKWASESTSRWMQE